MSHNEERMSALLTFPFGSFFMLRLEYVLLTGNELEAKILRLIEKRMDDERRRRYQAQMNKMPPGTKETTVVLDIPKNIWVPISHALFLYDLYGLVQSENTLKRALSSLLKKQLILTRKGQGRYAPTEYQLNLEKIAQEFAAMSKQGRAGYQPVTPSPDDLLSSAPGDQAVTISEQQAVILSSVTSISTVDPLRVSEIDPKRRETEKKGSGRQGEAEEQSLSFPASSQLPSAAAACIAHALAMDQHPKTEGSTVLPLSAPTASPAEPGTPLDPEAIVRLVEDKRGIPYDTISRSRQLRSAQHLIDLQLPLDVELLERVYDECYDLWWQQHFGALHVTHLVEREKQHGEPRIVRLLKRVQAKMHNATNVSAPSSQTTKLHPPNVLPQLVGVSGLPIIQAPTQPLAVIVPKRTRPCSAERMVS